MMTLLMVSAVLDKGCTTLMVADSMARCQVLGHTEDGPPEAEDCMAMLEVTIPATEHLEAESFTALSYPGSLVGRALGFNNREGFAWSMNSTTPRSHAHGIRESVKYTSVECRYSTLTFVSPTIPAKNPRRTRYLSLEAVFYY